MSRRETPEQIARDRIVSAEAVLDNEVDLRGYPHRLLAVVAGDRRHRPMSEAVAAAEVLERSGWELVNVVDMVNGGFHTLYAVLRRQ